MRMKLARHMSFHHDLHLLVFRPRGIITLSRIEKDIAILEREEDRAEKPFNRFSDLSNVRRIDVEFRDIFRISLHRRLTYKKHRPVKSAFYVTNASAARIVRLHALLTDYSPLKVKLFEDLADAAKWLSVPLEALEMDLVKAPLRKRSETSPTLGSGALVALRHSAEHRARRP